MPFTPAQLAAETSRQHEAAHRSEPQIRLVAGPGTGKSSTIEERVRWLLETDISPKALGVVSFTRASARDLQRRVRKYCEAHHVTGLNMSRIRSSNTRPELIVRSMVHRMGYRYALHKKDLPGRPDLVFSRHRKIIFLNGCFFHMHTCRYGKVEPKTNTEFWQKKRQSNVMRDKRNLAALKSAGWQVLTIWECWTKPTNVAKLPRILKEFLE